MPKRRLARRRAGIECRVSNSLSALESAARSVLSTNDVPAGGSESAASAEVAERLPLLPLGRLGPRAGAFFLLTGGFLPPPAAGRCGGLGGDGGGLRRPSTGGTARSRNAAGCGEGWHRCRRGLGASASGSEGIPLFGDLTPVCAGEIGALAAPAADGPLPAPASSALAVTGLRSVLPASSSLSLRRSTTDSPLLPPLPPIEDASSYADSSPASASSESDDEGAKPLRSSAARAPALTPRWRGGGFARDAMSSINSSNSARGAEGRSRRQRTEGARRDRCAVGPWACASSPTALWAVAGCEGVAHRCQTSLTLFAAMS